MAHDSKFEFKEWRMVRADAVMEFKNGLNFSADHVGSGIPVVGVGDFGTDFRLPEREFGRVEVGNDLDDAYFLKNEDLLFCRSNGNKALVGRVLYIQSTAEQTSHSGFTIRGRVTSTKFLPLFAAYYFSSSLVKQQFLTLGGGTNISNLSQHMLKSVEVPLPPLPEQQKIAAILSTWDRAIELTEKLIAAKQKRKQALMQRLLIGKVRFAEFDGKPWVRVPLGKLLKEVKRWVEWNDDDEYHLLSIRRRSGGMFDRERKYGRDILTKVMMTTEAGDFVIARMQAVHGAITVTPPECHGKHVSGSYSTFVAKDPNKLHMPFLNCVSQTLAFYRLLLLSSYGVTIEKMTFNLPWFLSEKIDLPPTLEEQKRIASVFEAFENEHKLLGKRLETLKQQKKGLMQQLLTGKVRVKADSKMAKG